MTATNHPETPRELGSSDPLPLAGEGSGASAQLAHQRGSQAVEQFDQRSLPAIADPHPHPLGAELLGG
jgi:hypothetical protein